MSSLLYLIVAYSFITVYMNVVDDKLVFILLLCMLLSKLGCYTGTQTTPFHPTQIHSTAQRTAENDPNALATFTVALTSEPASTVTVSAASEDESEGVVRGTTSHTFTRENWDVPRQFEVAGVDDDVADGNQRYIVRASVSAARDENYAKQRPVAIQLINVDDVCWGKG